MIFRRVVSTISLLSVLMLALPVSAATFELINIDATGVGLNDPTPFTPVGGNNATTLGQARINAFNTALQAWGAKLVSAVPIRVTASFAPLDCTSNTGTLGQAGPVGYFMNFPGAPQANTFYPAALANALAGTNRNSGSRSEIDAQFNGSVDTDPGCLGGIGFYYGYDGNAGRQIDFVNVLMHELGHGLGFISLVTPSTGRNFNDSNDNESSAFVIFDHFVLDQPSGRTFDQMTDSQRRAAVVDTGNLVWAGLNTSAESSQLQAGVANGRLQLYAPAQASDGSSVSHWDTAETPNLLLEPFVNTDIRALQSVDFTTCALEDIGWTVTSGCPDGKTAASVVPTPSPAPVTSDSSDDNGGGGAVNPLWLALLLPAALIRRRRVAVSGQRRSWE